MSEERQGEGGIKIACHGCGASYVVRDPSVQGQRFRAKCKRCGGIIVGSGDSSFAVMPEAGQGRSPRANDLDSDLEASSAADQWYVVKGGKPKGPLTGAEILHALSTGKLDPSTYVWKEGQPEWKRLKQTPLCRDTRAPAQDHHLQEESEEEASTRFFQPPLNGSGEDPFPGPTRALDAPPPDVDAGPRADDRVLQPELSLQGLEEVDSEVTRLHRGRIDEVSSKVSRLPDPDDWRQVRAPPRSFGAAPGKVQSAQFRVPTMVPAVLGQSRQQQQEREIAAVWAPAARRPAILPRPSRRHNLYHDRSADVAPAAPVPPVAAAPAAAVSLPRSSLATPASCEVSAHNEALISPVSPARLPGPERPPRPVPALAGPKVLAAEGSLSWIPNPTPLAPVVARPAAGPLLLPKVETFWTAGKILALVGGALGLAIIALLITLVLARDRSPQPGSSFPRTSRATAADPAASRASPAEDRGANGTETKASVANGTDTKGNVTKGEGEGEGREVRASKAPPVVAGKETGSKADRPTTVRVRTQVKKVAARPSKPAARARPREADVDDLLASAVRARSKPKRGAPAVDEDELLMAGRKPARKNPGDPSLSRDVDPDSLLSAGSRRTLARQLSKGQIQQTMGGLRSRVQACFEKYRVGGVLQIAMTVRSDGTAAGQVVGQFASTPTGNCAAAGIAQLQFARFSGPTMRFVYPFSLR